MADGVGFESGREAAGSQTQDAGNAGLARGAAGLETGAQDASTNNGEGSLEERRETEQVSRPTSDGMGEGLTKDQG